MGDSDSFEARLRAMVDEVSRSLDRLSEVDLDAIAGRWGVDAERARDFADAAGQWLSGRLAPERPYGGTAGGAEAWHTETSGAGRPHRTTRPGPHPLDLPSDIQGLALSALDSGRWTVRPGNNELSATGDGPPPPADAQDLVSELRARDWIASDGTPTLVGRHALARWCRGADEPPPPRP